MISGYYDCFEKLGEFKPNDVIEFYQHPESQGLFTRPANSYPAGATPGTGYLYTKSVKLRGAIMDWVWSAVTEFWRMVGSKTKAKVVGGRVWKFKGFCYEDI